MEQVYSEHENVVSPDKEQIPPTTVPSQSDTADMSSPGGPQPNPTHSTEAGSLIDIGHDIAALRQEMSHLRQDFDTKVKYDESKERLITSLHSELQLHRQGGLHFRILKPLFVDLITLHDELGKFMATLSDSDGLIAHHLALFQESIEEILQRNGVEIFQVEESTFLASKQRSLRIIATTDPALDKHVARRVHKGFEYEGKLLRPEIVELYKYTAMH